MKIYVSGGITGVSNFKENFANAQIELEEKGYEVINPAIVELPKSCTCDDYMKVTLSMLDLADGIYMLSNWRESKGALVEYGYALAQGKNVLYEDCNIEVVK